jgi:hypothetical protein
MAVGARAAEALPPDASPATVIRAVKRAMEDAAGVRRDPSPKEADRLAREKGEWVWGSDGRWHTGGPRPTREEMAEHDRLVAVRLAAYALADRGKRLEPPGRFLALIQDWAREEWVGGCSTRPSATCGGCAPPSATRKGPPHR